MTEPEKQKAEIKIAGMHGATCAVNIEESLAGLKDVSKAQVNFCTDTAHVEYDPSKVSHSTLENAVKEAGYYVVNRQVMIKVGGMMGATCVETIGTTLRELPGIVSTMVNLGTEKAYVTYNPSISGIDDMKKAIEEAGYQYLGISSEVNEEAEKIARDKDLHDKFVRFMVGFAVSIPLMLAMWVPLPISMQQLGYVMLVI
jgi:Cu+-exporting ATPase